MAFAVETFAPPAWREAALQAAGARIATFECGSEAAGAPVVVLLHGLGQWSDAAWGRLIRHLDPSFRYLAFDWPGFGDSERPAARYDLSYFVRVLGLVADAAGLDRFGLVGHSLGGCVAAAFAGADIERVTQLALIAPAGFARTPRFLVYGLAATFAPALFGWRPSRRFVTRTLRDAVVDPAVLEPSTLERTYQILGETGARDAYRRVYAGAVSTFARRKRLHAQWARYRGPVFCAWGRCDRYISAGGLRDVVRVYPRASTLILERSGHLPMIEEPARLGEALRPFLAQTSQ
jgi:pimeloyl-ACP methyl ester carboxylesterase